MSPRLVDILSLLIAILAAAGLGVMIYNIPPVMPVVALALLLLVLMVAGFTAPLWRILLYKVMNKIGDDEIMVMGLRFGLWTGIFVAGLVLLNIIHFWDHVLITAILALLIMLEMFLQQNATRKRGKRIRRSVKRSKR